MLWIANFRGVNRKTSILWEFSFFLGSLMIWKVMQSHVWSDILSWHTGRRNNTTKYLLHASMTTTSKKKKWNPWENCQKYALKLLWNVNIWQELDDLIFYGQWTNLHDPSQNGPKHVTNAWIDWFLTFIIHVSTNNIALWVKLPNNADKDCFKTLTSQEILKIQSLHQVEHCVFGSHSFVPISWMCKKQTSVSHSSTESEIISLDAGLRLDGIPSLDLWDLIVSVLGNTTQTTERPARPVVIDKSQKISRENQRAEKHWLCSLKRPVFALSSFVVCVWGQRSSD